MGIGEEMVHLSEGPEGFLGCPEMWYPGGFRGEADSHLALTFCCPPHPPYLLQPFLHSPFIWSTYNMGFLCVLYYLFLFL